MLDIMNKSASLKSDMDNETDNKYRASNVNPGHWLFAPYWYLQRDQKELALIAIFSALFSVPLKAFVIIQVR